MIASLSRRNRQLWAANAHLKQQIKWRELPADISAGWWLLLAEVLAVVVLLILAAVAGPVATAMSDDLDTWALAALAGSEPLSACINASAAASSTGWYFPNVGLVLASGLRASNSTYTAYLRKQGYGVLESGRVQHAVVTEVGDAPWDPFTAIEADTRGWRWGSGLFWNWTFPASTEHSQANHTSYRMLREVLAAMWECDILTGAYCDLDLPSFITRDCPHCDKSLREAPPGVDWGNASAGILSARGSLTSIIDCLFTNSVDHDTLNIGYEFVGNAYQMRPGGAAAPSLKTAFFLSDPAWGDPTRRAYVEDDLCCGGFVLPAGILRIPGVMPPWQPRVLWLGLAQQTQGKATCLADRAPMLRAHLSAGTHRLNPVDGPPNRSLDIVPGAENSGLEVREVWLQMLDGNRWEEPHRQYDCAAGVDLTSTAAFSALLRRQAYRESIKSKLYSVTLFGSMKNLSYDDVYAVYTAILGALFGAFALLVTTLFVFVLAILKRLLGPSQGSAGCCV